MQVRSMRRGPGARRTTPRNGAVGLLEHKFLMVDADADDDGGSHDEDRCGDDGDDDDDDDDAGHRSFNSAYFCWLGRYPAGRDVLGNPGCTALSAGPMSYG